MGDVLERITMFTCIMYCKLLPILLRPLAFVTVVMGIAVILVGALAFYFTTFTSQQCVLMNLPTLIPVHMFVVAL